LPTFPDARLDGLDLRTLYALPACACCEAPASLRADGVALCQDCYVDIQTYWENREGVTP
jgi:hypothetical protein